MERHCNFLISSTSNRLQIRSRSPRLIRFRPWVPRLINTLLHTKFMEPVTTSVRRFVIVKADYSQGASPGPHSEAEGGHSHSLRFIIHPPLFFQQGTDGSLQGKHTVMALKGHMKVNHLDDDCSIYFEASSLRFGWQRSFLHFD